MEQSEASTALVSDRVVVNGAVTSLALSEDGALRWWEGGQRCLAMDREVLGFSTGGRKIKIRAVVQGRAGICCVAGMGPLVRKDFVFQLQSEDMQSLWCQKLREYIDSLGISRPHSFFFFLSFVSFRFCVVFGSWVNTETEGKRIGNVSLSQMVLVGWLVFC